MSYTVQENYVEVVGKGWYSQTMATRYNLDKWKLDDIEKMSQDDYENLDENDWREIMSDWVDYHSGDFMHIEDFTATLDKFGVVIPWHDKDNEWLYFDLMYPELTENFDK